MGCSLTKSPRAATARKAVRGRLRAGRKAQNGAHKSRTNVVKNVGHGAGFGGLVWMKAFRIVPVQGQRGAIMVKGEGRATAGWECVCVGGGLRDCV
jgi:hypothetical protein